MPDRLRVLIVTNLFPNNVDPGFAPFNRQQFGALGRLADVEVYGVVPWRFGRFYGEGSSADVVGKEIIDDLEVVHPRFPSIPGAPGLNAGLMAASLLPRLLPRKDRYDVILGSYAYPDGCAAVLLGRALDLPVVVKAHGSDLNRVPGDRPARVQIQQLLPRAQAVVVVSRKLGEAAVSLGVDRDRIHVVYNGVNRERFKPIDRAEARRQLGLPADQELVVYVGHLAEHKGTADLLEATERLSRLRPEACVAFVGEGPLGSEVRRQAEHGGTGRILSVGRVSHSEVALWMAASDVVTLPSWNEGMPNVVREAHAVGRPVVATDVGGIPEAISRPELGSLVPAKDPAALAEALAAQLAAEALPPERIVELGLVSNWDESAADLLRVLETAAALGRPRIRRSN